VDSALLVARPLLVTEEHGLETRYRLLETIGQYGEQRLTERDELARWRAHHADYYASLLQRVREHAHDPRAEVFWAGERARVLRAPAGPPNHSCDRTRRPWRARAVRSRRTPRIGGGAGAKTSSILGQLAKELPTKEIAPAGCIRGAGSRSAYGRLLALLWSVEVVGARRCHCEGWHGVVRSHWRLSEGLLPASALAHVSLGGGIGHHRSISRCR
jgi:hypothetical protein